MEIKHEITTIDEKQTEEHFWFSEEDSKYKILSRAEMGAAFIYVRDNPEKFPELKG